MQKQFVCDLSEFEHDGRAQVELDDGHQVLLIKRVDGLVAVDALCPHQYAPLIGGEIDEQGVLACPFHGWRFSLQTGLDPDNPYICIQRFACGIDGDRVWVAEALPIPPP